MSRPRKGLFVRCACWASQLSAANRIRRSSCSGTIMLLPFRTAIATIGSGCDMMPRRVCGVVTRSRERGRQREQRCGQHESTETHVVCPFKNKKNPADWRGFVGKRFPATSGLQCVVWSRHIWRLQGWTILAQTGSRICATPGPTYHHVHNLGT